MFFTKNWEAGEFHGDLKDNIDEKFWQNKSTQTLFLADFLIFFL